MKGKFHTIWWIGASLHIIKLMSAHGLPTTTILISWNCPNELELAPLKKKIMCSYLSNMIFAIGPTVAPWDSSGPNWGGGGRLKCLLPAFFKQKRVSVCLEGMKIPTTHLAHLNVWQTQRLFNVKTSHPYSTKAHYYQIENQIISSYINLYLKLMIHFNWVMLSCVLFSCTKEATDG